MFIAEDPEHFRALFSSRLQAMLQPDAFGAYILVLANSMQDESSRQSLVGALASTYAQLRARTVDPGAGIAPDDADVFQQLAAIDIDRLGAWRTVSQGDWEINLNPMRALRPPRASAEVVTDLYRPFDAGRFHFNKPFLAPEILWEGAWRDCAFRVLFNKFPFAPHHLLLVPQPQRELPQYLDREFHERVYTLAGDMAAVVPGFAVAYNSIGAGASVNQLHFQSFVREPPLPVEHGKWAHNGGDSEYPVPCTRYNDAESAWASIRQLHDANNSAYNLLYRDRACYVIERRMQGDGHIDQGIRGAGWIELCGVFNVADEAVLRSLDADTLTRRLRSLRIRN